MRKIIIANKIGLYKKLLVRMKEVEETIAPSSQKGYIPFPAIFEKIGRSFSIKKGDIWEYLLMFQDLGYIQIIKFHGVKLKYEVKYEPK